MVGENNYDSVLKVAEEHDFWTISKLSRDDRYSIEALFNVK